MDTNTIAQDFAALCKEGKFDEAGAKYWASDIVSIEAFSPDGSDTAARGLDAVRAKGEWWYANHEVHSAEATGPYVNGDRFIIRFKMDVTMKETGMRMQMDEDGLYTVRDGKIVEERFFYSM
jgi:ketosteroid isomerase-like protein